MTQGAASTRAARRAAVFASSNVRSLVKGTSSASQPPPRRPFANVEVRDINGPTRITNSNGNVTATDVRSDLTVDTRFGLLRAERIKGSIDVDNSNGGVTASDIAGNARVHTSFGSVFLKGVTGAVTVENENGSIAVSGLRGACNDISLKTSFASIKVAVPATHGYNVDARTSFGSITTDVPITMTHKSENALEGTIGSGGCRMTLTDSNGNVTIGRE